MSFNRFLIFTEDLLLVVFQEIKCYVVCISFNRVDEKLYLERNFVYVHKCKGQSESPRKDKYIYDLVLFDKLLMRLQKLKNGFVSKYDLRFIIVLILSFILNHDGYKIDQFQGGHLVLVYLSLLDADQLVTYVFCDFVHDQVFEQMADNFIVARLKKVMAIQSRLIKIFVLRNSFLKFIIICGLSYFPAIMDKLPAIVKLWVHY